MNVVQGRGPVFGECGGQKPCDAHTDVVWLVFFKPQSIYFAESAADVFRIEEMTHRQDGGHADLPLV